MERVSKKIVLAMTLGLMLGITSCSVVGGAPNQSPDSTFTPGEITTETAAATNTASPSASVSRSPSRSQTASPTESESSLPSASNSGSASPTSTISGSASPTESPGGVTTDEMNSAALAFNLFLADLKVEWLAYHDVTAPEGQSQNQTWPESFRYVSGSLLDQDAKRLTTVLINEYREHSDTFLTYHSEDVKVESGAAVFDLKSLKNLRTDDPIRTSEGTVTMSQENGTWKITQVSPEVGSNK